MEKAKKTKSNIMDYKKFFTHPVTITVGIILSLGFLVWYGKANWGWFGGTTNDGFPSNPKDQDKFTKDGKVYVFRAIQCITTPCEGGSWVLFNEGDTPSGKRTNLSHEVSEKVSPPQPSSSNQSRTSTNTQPILNCKETKLINGVTHILWGVYYNDGQEGGTKGYFANWANQQTWQNTQLPITKQEYDDLKKKCFGTITTYPATLTHACNTEFKVGPHSIKYKFSGVALQGPVFGSGGVHSFSNYRAIYTAVDTIPPPPHSAYPMYENPYYYPLTKQEYDTLKNCSKNDATA